MEKKKQLPGLLIIAIMGNVPSSVSLKGTDFYRNSKEIEYTCVKCAHAKAQIWVTKYTEQSPSLGTWRSCVRALASVIVNDDQQEATILIYLFIYS